MAFTDIAYKYVDAEGAKKIISNCSLRFTRPSEMNDPFDVRIHELIDTELERFLAENLTVHSNQFLQNPAPYLKSKGIESDATEEIINALLALSDEEKSKLNSELVATDLSVLYPDLDGMKKRIAEETQFVISNLENSGIFCATRNYSNLLMWAHYADQHRGLVLGFKPYLPKDSMLTLLEPVIYSEQRPAFYDPKLDWVLDPNDEEATRRIIANVLKRINFTKSIHWSYEEELRLVIPDEVNPGNVASALKYHPEELVEIYFGCRMQENIKNEISVLAQKLNPKVSIFQTHLAKYSYELQFTKILEKG